MTKTALTLLLSLVSAVALLSAQTKAPTSPLSIFDLDGGPVTITLSAGIAIHKESSLHRQWYVLNDSSTPVSLSGTGINIKYRGQRGYVLSSDGIVSAIANVSAIEVVAMLFDLWGEHLRNLDLVVLRDLNENATFPLSDAYEWPASDRDTTEYLTCVTYVRTVRSADGKVWHADMSAIRRKLSEIQIKTSDENLGTPRAQDKRTQP
jgi:hypothetical protein